MKLENEMEDWSVEEPKPLIEEPPVEGNPYLIDSPSSVCFSGGRTSGKMLFEILSAFKGELPSDIKVCFENTGKEREETLEFVHEVEQRWNVPVVWLEYNDTFNIEDYISTSGKLMNRRRPWTKEDLADPKQRGFRIADFKTASRNGEPFDMMLAYYAEFRATIKNDEPILPTVPSRICTTHLKIKINTRYMQSLGYDYFDAIQGIRYDEPRRWAKMMALNAKGNERYNNVLPLYDARIVKKHVMEFWSDQPFDLKLDPESYAGNCDFCFLKNTDKIVNLMRLRLEKTGGEIPADIQWWVDKEANAGMTFRQNRSYSGLVQIAQSGLVLPPSEEPAIDCVCGAADD
jgi:3'-phosphoadenosine 5'-phosphosulfate sulfotransferase (PAPS reductase)/FAD synthetase